MNADCAWNRFTRSGEAAIYDDCRGNVVVWPGQETALQKFVNQTYGGRRHKLVHTKSSHSEDALTWSCFDTLNCLTGALRTRALAHLWALAFDERPAPQGFLDGKILIGKKYGQRGEETEVDASVEGAGVLVFIEAKLYSPMSMADADNGKPHNQIVRKLRVGIKEAKRSGIEFFFILLDIAPKKMLRALRPRVKLAEACRKGGRGFASKWQTAYWFSRYKGRGGSVTPLRKELKDIPGADAANVARNMGWLTWADVYKVVLRATITSHQLAASP